MDILFLGGLFPEELENEILKNSKSTIDNAANVLQWKIIDGLDKVTEQPVFILNSLFIGTFPEFYSQFHIKTVKFKHCNDIYGINVGYLNLRGICRISKYWSLRPYLKKWALNDDNNDKVLISYSLSSVFSRCIKYIKKINKNIKIINVVTDLPQFMNTSNNKQLLSSYRRKLVIDYIYNNLNLIDGFVLLTEQMKEALKIKDKPYIVIEGIANNNNLTNKYNKDNNIKKILYTGTLNQRYGILNLLQSFEKINNPNYRLLICGDGDSKQEVIRAAQNDKRIEYYGHMNNNEIIKMQKEAIVLINPRQNNEEFTKFSFPSKIIEYLSSGTPVIAYKLDGIPNEYDNYIYYVEDNTIKSLTNKIINICQKDEEELFEFGENAKNFIVKSKNSVIQANKIINMIKMIEI